MGPLALDSSGVRGLWGSKFCIHGDWGILELIGETSMRKLIEDSCEVVRSLSVAFKSSEPFLSILQGVGRDDLCLGCIWWVFKSLEIHQAMYLFPIFTLWPIWKCKEKLVCIHLHTILWETSASTYFKNIVKDFCTLNCSNCYLQNMDFTASCWGPALSISFSALSTILSFNR